MNLFSAMVDLHADDEIHAGLNAYERGELADDLDWLAGQREAFRDAVSAAAAHLAQSVRERHPEWICTFSFATRRDSESPDEVAQGFIEQVAACARDLESDFFDHDALERAERMAETGRDE